MCRSGLCRFGFGNWIFLLATLNLFTCAQGGEDDEIGIRFTSEPSDVIAAAGEAVLLSCGVSSVGAVRLSWRHSAHAAPTHDHELTAFAHKHRKQLTNGSLLIESVTSSVAGHYQCVARADNVGTIVSRVAVLTVAELPELSMEPRSVLGVPGGAVLLPCALRVPAHVSLRVLAGEAGRRLRGHAAGRGGLPPPPPTLAVNVTWVREGSPVRLESARVSLTASGALEIDPAREHDAGEYACRLALPQQATIYRTSGPTALRISPAGTLESAPRFIATPLPATVLEGAQVTFDCAAVGSPRPEITWLSNGVAIDLSDLDSRFYLVGSGSLVVASARPQDAGQYTCRATNAVDSHDHTAQLTVLTSPRVVTSGPVVTAQERGDVTLRCEVRGRPPPAVTWLKDGETLTPNNHDIALVDTWSLRIQGVLSVDAGMFQCAARSAAGSAAAALRLQVLPRARVQNKSDPIDPKSLLNSLVTSIKTSSPQPSLNPSSSHTAQDIFNSLAAGPVGGPHENELDFLGETSSAFTAEPEMSDVTYDTYGYDYDDYDTSVDDLPTNSSLSPPPHSLTAVLVKHRFVTLTWQPPPPPPPPLAGAGDGGGGGDVRYPMYAVYYRVKGSERQRVSLGALSRHEMVVGGLQPNTTYEVYVRAYTEHAASPPTQTLVVHTPHEELTHGAPPAVRAEPLGPHAVRVTWGAAPPLPRGGEGEPPPPPPPPPTHYQVYYTESESNREQFQSVEADPASSSVSTTLTGLRAATTYTVRVSASDGAPAALSVRTASDAPAAPPLNVSATHLHTTSIVVRWEPPPPRTHRGPLTGYKVRYRAAGAGPLPPRRRPAALTTAADVTTAEITGLEPGQVYQIRVCAINANGSGPFSEWVTCRTASQPEDESSVPHQPPPLTTRAGRDWISVWWAESGAPPPAGDGGGPLVRAHWLGWGLGVPDEHTKELPAHLHSHVIRQLESNSEYVISLRASNALGLGPPVYATVRTKEGGEGDDFEDDDDEEGDEEEEEGDETPPLIPPVGLKVIMLSGTTAVVYWTDPTLPKGQTAVDGRRYVVRWSTAGSRPRSFNASDLNCMLDDLRPYTTYEFKVKLIRGGRESPWSMVVTNTTLEAAPGSPPRDLRAAPSRGPEGPARAVDLTWLPPLRANGLITGYVIMYSASANSSPWTGVSVGAERGMGRVTGLRPRTQYQFRVQARNGKGLGPFTAALLHTTAMEAAGEGAGLAAATSAWLWASAGGACAVLALAAALALSLCCRREHAQREQGGSTYQKSSATAAIKPPDLWIHHDQMELKHMDKSQHGSNMSGSSCGALASSTLTLSRGGGGGGGGGVGGGGGGVGGGAEYEPARGGLLPTTLDRDYRHHVPTYVESVVGSLSIASDDTAALVDSPLPPHQPHYHRSQYTPMGGVGSVGHLGPPHPHPVPLPHSAVGGAGGPGCAASCDRRHQRNHHIIHDQSTPLLAGMAPLSSPHSSLGSLLTHSHAHTMPHPHQQVTSAPCGSAACPLGASCGGGGPIGGHGPLGTHGGHSTHPTGDIYACAARERGHYVAYEPLGHYTHRDSVSSEAASVGGGAVTAPPSLPPAGGGGGGGSLQRRPPHPQCPPLHTFSDGSDHSTPTHSNNSVRECSPYKKSPGHTAGATGTGTGAGTRLHRGGPAVCSSELEPLTPSRSTERLQREMQNLEGLMKDLSAITHGQFHC